MGVVAVGFAVDVFISTLCIYVAAQLNFLTADIKEIAVIIFSVSLVSLVPYIGWIAGILLFVYLLMKIIDCSITDAVWVVLVSKMLSFVAMLAVSPLASS